MTTTKNNEHKKLNFSSEREQSQACLNSAEHEKNQGRKVLNVPNKQEQKQTCLDSAEREGLRPKGNVPNLRFPEFQGEWDKCKFRDVCSISTGNKNTQDKIGDGIYPFYVRSQTVERINSWTFDGEAILTAGDGVGVGKVFHHTYGKIGVHQRVYILSDFKCDANYLFHFFSSKFYNRVKRMSAKNSVDSVRKEMITDMPLSLPSHQEQVKIGYLLSLLDERIATQNKIIDKLQSLIKGIMVELQKQGVNKGTWKKVFLSDVLTERNERNTNLFQVFSVSVSQGVVNQVDYLGRSFAAKDTSKYNVVHYGDLVYTKSPTGSFPYGIVKQSLNLENVAVSPLYGVYKPKSLAVGAYLHEYFMSEINTHNYLHPLIQKGAKNTINITNQRFLENCVLLPTNINELLQISKLLRSLNNKIKYQQDILQQYQKQKKYLLRQMFI